MTSLANEKAYRFRIRAVNSAGSGPQSDIVGPVTPSSAPVPTVTDVSIVSEPKGWTVTHTELVDGRFVHTRYGGAPDTYAQGEKIWIEVTFSTARIAVEGKPVLKLHVGATDDDDDPSTDDVPVVRYADYLCPTGDNSVLFEYRTAYADKDTDGISIPANAIVLPAASPGASGAAIRNPQGGKDADLTHAALGDNPAHKGTGCLTSPKGSRTRRRGRRSW